MKKLTMIMAALAAMTFSAVAADVFSSNIVGYTKVPVSAGLNLLGSQFVTVGDNSPLDISTLIQSGDLEGFDENYVFQSELKVWTGGGYTTYGWSADGQGTANDFPEWDSKWLTYGMDDLANVTIPTGDGFWIQTTAPASIIFTGEVSTNNTFDLSVSAGLNLVCNPFPTEISIQGVQSADLAGFDESYVFQSELKVWTGGGYATYGWSADGQGTTNDFPEWDSKWLTYGMDDLANVTIGIGEAFWIKTTDPATLTFTK